MEDLDKFEILKAYVYLNKDKIIDEVKETKNIIFAHSKDSTEEWWNFALLKNPLTIKDLKLIETFFEKRKKLPSVYFSDDFDSTKDFLLKKGYSLNTIDSWMFWNHLSPELKNENIIKINNDKDFESWLDTYIKSYPENDPKNPYGEQKEFASILKNLWYERKIKNEQFYMALNSINKPVAVGLLTNHNKIGEISAIGSIPEVRGKGFGKKMSLYCVQESFKQGNNYHLLTTEEGDYPYEFYKRIGFEPKFTAYLFTKK